MPGPPLIFDLDDTLIESFPSYVRLHQRIAGELGWPVPSREALVPYLATWEETLAALWPGQDLAPFIQRYLEVAADHPYRGVPGAREALETLAAAGHSLWIVTKRSRDRLAIRLAEAELPAEMFQGIFPAEDQPALKPDPRCFEPVWHALGRAHPDPRAIYVGDRHEDRAAAEGAGINFFAVLTGPEVGHGFPGDLPAERILATVAELPVRLGERSRRGQ